MHYNPSLKQLSSWSNHSVVVKARAEPKSYARPLKWFMTFIVGAASVLDTLYFTVLFPALPDVVEDLHTTHPVANLASTLAPIGLAIGPLYWGAVSERCGRRTTYLISILMSTVFAAAAGAAQNISVLVAFRVLGSFFSCSVIIIGGAVVADIWEVKERGFAMSLYYIGPLCGPAVGTVLGGALVYISSWRTNQWFLTCYGATTFLLILLFVPETMAKNPLQQEPEPDTDSTSASDNSSVSKGALPRKLLHRSQLLRILRRACFLIFSPLAAVTYLRFPAILSVVFLTSTNMAAIVTTLTSIQSDFTVEPYNFDALITGLMCLPMPIGMICGSLISGKWSDFIMHREAQSRVARELDAEEVDADVAVVHRPEDRVRENALVSTLLLPATLLCYGWTVQFGVFWVGPMVPWFMMGVAGGLMFGLCTTILTELVPHRSATMVAIGALGKNLLAAITASIELPLVNVVGLGWFFTILAAVALCNIGVVVMCRRYGLQWRSRLDEFGRRQASVEKIDVLSEVKC